MANRLLFYILPFFACLSSAFGRDIDRFPSATEMSEEKLHHIANVVRGPLPKENVSMVSRGEGTPEAEITTLYEGMICVNCLQLPRYKSFFCLGREDDFLGLGVVHSSVAQAAKDLLPYFRKAFTSFFLVRDIGQVEVIFTGYSSGASIASLLAADFVKNWKNYDLRTKLKPNQVKIIGFETQRVGSRMFVDNYFRECIPEHDIVNFWHVDDRSRDSFSSHYVSLGLELTSPPFTHPQFPSHSNHSLHNAAKFLEIASTSAFLRLGYLNLSLTHRDRIPKKYVVGIGIVGVLGITVDYCISYPSKKYMFSYFHLTSTISKLNKDHGYFSS